VFGRIILKLAYKKWDGGMDWFNLAHDGERWWALVNAVMNLSFAQNAGKLLTG